MAEVAEAVGNESYSYLLNMMQRESFILNLDSSVRLAPLLLHSWLSIVLAHRYYLAARAALFIPITMRGQGHDRHRRRHEESNMIVIRERTHARSLASVSTPSLHAWTLSELSPER